jgi:hypothetical protein
LKTLLSNSAYGGLEPTRLLILVSDLDFKVKERCWLPPVHELQIDLPDGQISSIDLLAVGFSCFLQDGAKTPARKNEFRETFQMHVAVWVRLHENFAFRKS